MIEELYNCQQALGNGYLSAFPEKILIHWNPSSEVFGRRIIPIIKSCRVYWMFIERTGIKKAYEMVVNMASYVEKRMAKLDKATIEKVLYTAEANPSNEYGAMNDVLYKLYKVSKNQGTWPLQKYSIRDWFAVTFKE
jgi:hypothetical protein